jgi:dihydrofolate reductase
MGEIVVTEFVSLDGVFEDPGGAEGYAHGGWTFGFDRGEEGDRFKLEELRAAEGQLLGRVTYAGFAKAWPDMEHSTGEFGEKMNNSPKFVLSSTLTDADATWRNTTVLRGPLSQEIPALKERVAGALLVAGSGTLVTGLLAAGLVDELHLMVFPIVLGSGRRLFGELSPPAPPARLRLTDSRTVGRDGVLVLTYRRDG